MSGSISCAQRRVSGFLYLQTRSSLWRIAGISTTSLKSRSSISEDILESENNFLAKSQGDKSSPKSFKQVGPERATWRQNIKPFSSFLTDTYSRQHNYLRISVTERCNLRCLYCMPEEGVRLSPEIHNLTTPEIVYLSMLFVEQGVTKIRLTGGEPTVRKDIVDLVQQIGALKAVGLKELCITTNGITLHRKLDAMVEAGLTNINLSLDTLDPFQFTLMTRRNGFEAVKKSIDKILSLKRSGVSIKFKINCVVMRGLNDREVIQFTELGRNEDIEVRFIEYMPFDGNKWSKGKMITYMEILNLIKQKYPGIRRAQDHPNDTSKAYKIPGFVGSIGFVTSMTEDFCSTCNRLRITSDGSLKVCLFGNDEVSLRDILRGYNDGRPIDADSLAKIKSRRTNRQHMPGDNGAFQIEDPEARLLRVIGMAVKRKKEKHADLGELENMENRPMILIGG
jgi:GTP 3',8-cyclase